MREATTTKIGRHGQLAFMATTTIVLLAFALDEAESGLQAIPAVVVYARAAGFGLEFILAAWTGSAQAQRERRGARR